MLALSRRAAMREAPHGFAHPKREHGSRTPKARTVHRTIDRSQSGKNDLSATESLVRSWEGCTIPSQKEQADAVPPVSVREYRDGQVL